jgi:hypothetical protein
VIERKIVPVNDEYAITVVTERMNDGGWAVVASITHRTPSGEQVIDLPIQDRRFADPREAEEAGVRQGRDWLASNVAHAA